MRLRAILALVVACTPASAWAQEPQPDQVDVPDERPLPADEQPAPVEEAPPPLQPVQVEKAPCALEGRDLEREPSAWAAGEPIAGYTIVGDFQEPETTLLAVFDPLLPKGAAYTPLREACVLARLDKLQYRLDGGRPKGKRRADGIWLTFRIHPATVVRHVDISIDFGILRKVFPPVLNDDIRTQLRYREGSPVPDDERERGVVFDEESQRIEEWLAKRGFFEARVLIHAEIAESEYQLTMHVEIKPGPAYSVGKITLVGNTSIPDDEILPLLRQQSFFGLRDDPFSKDALNRSVERVKRLYHNRGFPGVRVRTDFDVKTSADRRTRTVNLTVTITELKKIDTVFEGNAAVTQAELELQLTFAQEGSFDDIEVENSAEAIRRYYQTKGYFQVVVTWERVRLLPTFERILFYIDEGPEQRVREIRFTGNKGIGSDTLAKALSTKVYGTFLSSGGYLTPRQLEQDVATIEDLYRRQGYGGVHVSVAVAPRRELLDAPGAMAAAVTSEALGGNLYILFTIDEGPRDTVGIVEFVGNRALNDRDLESVVRVRPGGPFYTLTIDKDVDAIQRRYKDIGFPHATVSDQLSPVDPKKPGVYRVRFVIDEGPPVKVGKVLVRGNFKTKDWVIKDVFGLAEGKPLTLQGLRQGQEALRSIGLFAAVRLDLLGIDPEEKATTVHAFIDVEEQYDNNGEFGLGFGYRTNAEWFAQIEYKYPNLFGIGASTSAGVLFGLKQFIVEGTGRLPYWVMRRGVKIPMDLSLRAFDERRQQDRFGQLENLGATATLSRLLRRDLLLSVGYELKRTTIEVELVRGAGANEDLEFDRIPTNTTSLGFAIVLDRRRPTPIAPTDGFKLGLSTEWTSSYLGGNEDFLKFEAQGAFFFRTLARRVLVKQGLRYNHGVPLGGDVVLPETERYFAGGNTTIRGLDEDYAFTEVIRTPLTPGGPEVITVRPAGGNISFIYNLDLQVTVCDCFPIGDLPIATGIFFDTGLVTNSFQNFEPSQLRHSAGVALMRVLTPFLDVSLEYAIPLDPGPGDDPTGRFHFNFGFVLN